MNIDENTTLGQLIEHVNEIRTSDSSHAVMSLCIPTSEGDAAIIIGLRAAGPMLLHLVHALLTKHGVRPDPRSTLELPDTGG